MEPQPQSDIGPGGKADSITLAFRYLNGLVFDSSITRPQFEEFQRRLIAVEEDLTAAKASSKRWEAVASEKHSALSRQNEEICQILGRALGYPRFADDPKNFPDATDADGVCVGDHVAESLASEIAEKLVESNARASAVAAQVREDLFAYLAGTEAAEDFAHLVDDVVPQTTHGDDIRVAGELLRGLIARLRRGGSGIATQCFPSLPPLPVPSSALAQRTDSDSPRSSEREVVEQQRARDVDLLKRDGGSRQSAGFWLADQPLGLASATRGEENDG